MLVLPQVVKVKWHGKNKKWYMEKGYSLSKIGDEFEVDVLDLMKNSPQLVKVVCDYCKEIVLKGFGEYNKSHKENEDCCKKCKGKKIYKSKEKYNFNEVKKEFEKRGYVLLENEYINVHTDMKYICTNGHETKITFASLLNNNGCRKCARQNISIKQRKSIDEVKNIFKENNCILLTHEYINAHQRLSFICECGNEDQISLNKFLIGRRCKICGIQKRSGENHPKYNPNLTEEERINERNIEGYSEWRMKVYKRDNYTCQCCGDSKSGHLNAHHLDGYDWCKEKRTDVDNGITLCEKCHIAFHNDYGRGKNTKEQFEKWIKINNLIKE